MNYQEIIESIRENGYRLTMSRKSVIEILCRHKEYLGAYDIYNILKQQDIHVGISSIYRVLDLLDSLSLVQREEFGSGGERFRLNISKKNHAHQLICSNCGSIKEFGNCPIEDLAKKLESQSGYQIQEHWLRLYGLCPKCSKH